MQHLISIIMPAYNAGKYVDESIRSVLSQTYPNWELIVVNDGSTDQTAEIVKRHVTADSRIKFFEQPNGGQASARNTALANAAGDLIAFLDADDLWIAEKLSLQIDALNTSDVDFVFCRGYVISDNETREAADFATPLGKIEGHEMFQLLFAANVIASPSPLVRRHVVLETGGLDEDRQYQNCEDYDLWLTMAQRGARFYAMGERLFKYRRHATAATYDESRVLRPMIAVLRKHAASGKLPRREVEARLRGLYRNLVAALVREDRLPEARSTMDEFVFWDRGRLVTRTQQALLRWWPCRFNFLSTECLFRIEWHLDRLVRR